MLIMDEKEARSNSITKRGLFSMLGDDVMVDTLESGDFASYDTPLTLGIEHKAFNDFVHSLSSNRLDEQCSRLLEQYDVPVLLVDEIPAPNPGGKCAVYGSRHQVSYAWVMGSIMGWALRGVIPIMVRTPGSVAATVAAIYKVCGKEEHRQHFEPKRLLENLRPLSLTEKVLIQFPGVGPERASGLKGNSLCILNEWTRKDWQKALGALTGGRVYDAWHPEVS